MEEGNSTTKLLNNLGQLIAVIMIVRYALIIVNSYVTFIPETGAIPTILNYVGIYAPMALMITVGLSAVWSKSNLVKLAFLIICFAIVVFSFDFGLRGPIEGFLGL